MRLYDLSLVVIVVVCVAVGVGLFAQKYLGKDNFVEQVAEEVIEDHTGIDVDLSPEENPAK